MKPAHKEKQHSSIPRDELNLDEDGKQCCPASGAGSFPMGSPGSVTPRYHPLSFCHPAGCWQLGAVFQDKAESSQGDATARDSPCVIWSKKSQYFQCCSLCFPSFPMPRQIPTLEPQPGLGDLSTDHTGKLKQSSPPPHPKSLGKHFPPEIGLERMSTNKGPFIPAGTAGRDTRADPVYSAGKGTEVFLLLHPSRFFSFLLTLS